MLNLVISFPFDFILQLNGSYDDNKISTACDKKFDSQTDQLQIIPHQRLFIGKSTNHL